MVLRFLILLVPFTAQAFETPAELGRALFFDLQLSGNQTQSCATCHNPSTGYADARDNDFRRAVSIGASGKHGRRNAPTLTYIGEIPALHRNVDGLIAGGFFYDGRARRLTDQAKGPLFSELELALPSAKALASRIGANRAYMAALARFFSPTVATDPDLLVRAVSESLAAFQSSTEFAPFNSKYDQYLQGAVELSKLEEHGRLLFFSTLINCNSCHELGQSDAEIFTDYTYHNIGTPANPSLNQPPDQGLAENPSAGHSQHRGKFRVPTLRNIAVTGPYMHNGVFQELETVVAFYNQYQLVAPINPETGQIWAQPEVAENLSLDLLKQGQPLDQYRSKALIAFLKTLTDQRYTYLLE